MKNRRLLSVLGCVCGVILVISIVTGTWIANKKFGIFLHPDLKKMTEEAKPFVRRIEEYKSRNGDYPKDMTRLSTEGVSGSGAKWNAFSWYYAGDGQSYSIHRFTGRGRDTLWYGNEPFSDHKYRWYLDDESGNPVKVIVQP